jgi:hypothetical protein
MPDWALTIAAKINKSAKFVSSSVGKIITYDTYNVSCYIGKRVMADRDFREYHLLLGIFYHFCYGHITVIISMVEMIG